MTFLDNLRNNIPPHAALVGRIKSWLESSESRLPVSCTVMSVEDSMEGKNGIEQSWVFTSHGLRNAAGITIDLSKLRPANTANGRGLVSSGAASFAKIYSQLNEVLRRGGIFKNGSVVLFLDADHPDCEAFLNLSPSDLPWAKKTLYVDHTIHNNPLLDLIAEKMDQGSVWLAKKQYDKNGKRIYSNVCNEVLLPSRGTCLLHHVNLGIVQDLKQLPSIFRENMEWLCELHPLTGIDTSKEYLSPMIDKQVGLGVIGLANMLAIHDTSYADFVADLEDCNKGIGSSDTVAYWMHKAHMEAGEVASLYRMERAFVVAPTANCSRYYQDSDGFTTAPEISPPLAFEVDRDSGTFGVETYEYHPKSELASEVGWAVQWRLLNAWQIMMDQTGVAHAISANIWNDQKVTADWISSVFMPSALKTTYYRLKVDQTALDKSQVVLSHSSDLNLEIKTDTVSCSVDNKDYCESCGG
jgi:hypothetical protein